jgi:hypothetical protein
VAWVGAVAQEQQEEEDATSLARRMWFWSRLLCASPWPPRAAGALVMDCCDAAGT